jgi:hypothetical protein
MYTVLELKLKQLLECEINHMLGLKACDQLFEIELVRHQCDPTEYTAGISPVKHTFKCLEIMSPTGASPLASCFQ